MMYGLSESDEINRFDRQWGLEIVIELGKFGDDEGDQVGQHQRDQDDQ